MFLSIDFVRVTIVFYDYDYDYCHDRAISEKKGHLAEKNFIIRML